MTYRRVRVTEEANLRSEQVLLRIGAVSSVLGVVVLFVAEAGLALTLGRMYPRVLGWGGMALGAAYVAAGALVAHNGFTVVGFTATVGSVLALWFLFLALALWRRAGEEVPRSGDPAR